MNRPAMVVVDLSESATAGASWWSAVLGDWTGPGRPEVVEMPAGRLSAAEGPPPGCRLVWVGSAEQTSQAVLEGVLGHLADWQVPVVVSGPVRPGGEWGEQAVVYAGSQPQARTMRLVLEALLSQGRLVEQLKEELALSRRQQGGLLGQIGRLDEEMRLAAGVQREFLPRQMPAVGSVEVAAFFRPASYVSGDIYDVMRLDEDHIGFWIADVVGHGVPAALLTMFIKRALPTKQIGQGSYRLVRPDRAMAQLNAEMFAQSRTRARFATAVYGLLNCRTLQLQLARAGHPLPLLLRAGGQVIPLNPDGPLLAVFEEAEFALLRMQLEGGDRLLLYSDGFEQALGRPGRQASEPECRQRLAGLAEGPVEMAMARLGQMVDGQPGSLHQQDDLTAILVHIRP